jgi:copper chaperone
MQTDTIIIANLSCDGCVITITKKITAMNGVENVMVDLEKNNVLVNHNENVSRQQITDKLLSIGYPEATEENGLLMHVKSIVSCLSGKISNSVSNKKK